MPLYSYRFDWRKSNTLKVIGRVTKSIDDLKILMIKSDWFFQGKRESTLFCRFKKMLFG
jgi:hypothetical protein